MKLLTVIKNGEFTGVQYDQDKPEIWAHHASQDEDLITLDYRLVENGEGVYDAPTAEELAKILPEKGTRLVEGIIQDVVDTYNRTHGLAFTDVHACASYRENVTYPHQQFCSDVWAWNIDMWETARGILSQVKSGGIAEPTLTEFVALLPGYAGVL